MAITYPLILHINPPLIRQLISPLILLGLLHLHRQLVHPFQMILQIIPPRKRLSITRAALIHAPEIRPGGFMNGFLVPIAVVWGREAFCAEAVRDSAAVEFEVFGLVFTVVGE